MLTCRENMANGIIDVWTYIICALIWTKFTLGGYLIGIKYLLKWNNWWNPNVMIYVYNKNTEMLIGVW